MGEGEGEEMERVTNVNFIIDISIVFIFCTISCWINVDAMVLNVLTDL